MNLFERLYKEIINESTLSVEDVERVIDNRNRIIINYHSKGEDKNTGARVVEVVAYGLTKAGNPVIRCFQPYGDTTTKVPSWKFFRLDRISAWEETKQHFTKPADFYYKNIGAFNKNGDETMSVVYKIVKFDDTEPSEEISQPNNQPKTHNDVFKTDTEKSIDRLKQQVSNPIKLSDIKKNDSFKQLDNPTVNNQPTNEPKSKEDVYKTPTERGMERLKQQLNNPKYVDSLRDKQVKEEPIDNEENDNKENQSEEELYKTPTERNMERLKNQLNNPQKIDLSKFKR